MWKFKFIIPILFVCSSCGEAQIEDHSDFDDDANNPKETEHAITVPIKIELYGQQFKWIAHYAGKDNELAKLNYKLINDHNEIGILTTNTIEKSIGLIKDEIRELKMQNFEALAQDINEQNEELHSRLDRKERQLVLTEKMLVSHDSNTDKHALDDFLQTDTLYLLKGVEHLISARSKDVIHSPYFPHFRAQLNAVPGMSTNIKFTPEQSTREMRRLKNDKNFNFVMMCNKVCGTGHYQMKMIIVVLEIDELKEWSKSKRKDTLKYKKYFAK